MADQHHSRCTGDNGRWSNAPWDQMWLSLSMIMLDKSCRCASIPPTSMPYFSTSRKPGVVLRVPAMIPSYPCARAMSLNFFDLPSRPPASQRTTASRTGMQGFRDSENGQWFG